MILLSAVPDALFATFVRDLRRIPELFEQLNVTITKTDVTRPRGDGSPGSGHDRPLILNDRASEQRRSLLRTLRHAAAPVPYAPRPLRPGAAALAILDQLPHTSRGHGAEFWIRSILREITKAWGVVDAPASLAFSGYCFDCGAPVSAPGHLRAVSCRACGGEHQAAEHRAWMWQEAQQVSGTAAELARLLPHFDNSPVKAATIRKWHERGKLSGCIEKRGTVFRLGDVLALHRVRATPLRSTLLST
ncbi:hypothetical protein D5S18_28215 [Nocardia panacis]|uniref:Uncharacterized protein n=1 Tax=Nocardia panacis TaxID=2340916 RepID=A0A3A4KAZ9_9NOCA|nr:hypothetical protein [Nocardia panacis]RJO69788.1 hypothetical protein D5S18_28215 [Nocardia panacis]